MRAAVLHCSRALVSSVHLREGFTGALALVIERDSGRGTWEVPRQGIVRIQCTYTTAAYGRRVAEQGVLKELSRIETGWSGDPSPAMAQSLSRAPRREYTHKSANLNRRRQSKGLAEDLSTALFVASPYDTRRKLTRRLEIGRY